MLKVVTVCGLGVGSSLIMKMTVENALKKLNVKSQIEHWDMGTIKSKDCDLIVTTNEFKKNFSDQNNVIYLENIVDDQEAERKLKEYLEANNLLGG